MEFPEINMISDFEAGMSCLQNPSRFYSFPSPHIFSFWKWGALIFAIFATFTSIIRRIKLIFIHFRVVKSPSHHREDIFEFGDDDDEISLASSDDDDEDDRDGEDTTSSRRVDQDFRVKNSRLCFRAQGQSGQPRRRSAGGGAWSDFTSGKNVVKLWDSLKLSLDFDEDLFNYDPQTVVSTWESDQFKEEEFSGGVWNIPATAPTVLLKAKGNRKGGGVVLSGYDTRIRRRVPALYAEWSSPSEKVAGVSTGGVGQVYVRDDVSGVLTVGDVRNVRRALESVREPDTDTWWDADAVIVEEDFGES